MSSTVFTYVYLHGFLSSKNSSKGRLLRKRFAKHGVDLHLLDLSEGAGVEAIKYSGALRALHRYTLSHKGKKCRLIGSSLGGYIAARYAEMKPGSVDSLVLLNPAFDLMSRWPVILGQERWRSWQQADQLEFTVPSCGSRVLVPFSFIQDARLYPKYPAPTCRCLVMHACNDDTIPLSHSHTFQKRTGDHVKVVSVKDDHAMLNASSLDLIEVEALSFFGIAQEGAHV